MNPFKFTLFSLLCLTSIKGFSQYTDVINSNRPGLSSSAFSVGTNVVQFEAGPAFVKEKRTPSTAYDVVGFGVDFAIRYGLLLEELEINIEGDFQNDTKTTYAAGFENEIKRGNFKQLAIGAKYLVYDPLKNKPEEKPDVYSWKANRAFKWKTLIPAVSISVGANFDLADNPYTAPGIEGFSPKVMIATQNNLSGGWVFVMNFGKDRIGTEQSDFQYILTLTRAITHQWVVFGETQGIHSDFYADNLFRFGGAYLWGKNFQLDTAVTFNTKDTPAVFNVNLGMSYRLDFHKDKDPESEEAPGGKNKGSGKKKKNKKQKTSAEPVQKRNKQDIDFD